MGVSVTGYKNSIVEEDHTLDHLVDTTILVRTASDQLGDVSVGYGTISHYRKALTEQFHTESSKPFEAFVNSGNDESIIDPDKCRELAAAYGNADYQSIPGDLEGIHSSMRGLINEVALYESGCIVIR